MFCRNCGKELAEGISFCPNCGEPVAAQNTGNPQPQGAYEQPAEPAQPEYSYGQQTGPQMTYEQPAQPQYTYPTQESPVYNPTQIMVFGIVGLACAWYPVASIVGIVFSALAMSRGKKYLLSTSNPSVKAKVGRGLGIGGLVCSIVMTVIYSIAML